MHKRPRKTLQEETRLQRREGINYKKYYLRHKTAKMERILEKRLEKIVNTSKKNHLVSCDSVIVIYSRPPLTIILNMLEMNYSKVQLIQQED